MDQYYLTEDARIGLEGLMKERIEQDKGLQLSAFGTSGGVEHTVVHELPRPKMLKLVTVDDEGDANEIVMRVQGVLCSCDLAPSLVKDVRNLNSKRLRYLKQSVTLTGFSSPEFDTYVTKIDEIHRLFSRNLPPNTLHPWSPDIFNDHPAITISNRLFTDRHDQGAEPDLSFLSDLDPRGLLERSKGQDLVHLAENQVDFFELTTGKSGPQYVRIPPVKFRNGDIVEAQLSFNCIKAKDQHRLLVVLRALTLLNDQYVTNASIAANKARAKSKEEREVVLKRKVGYGQVESSRMEMPRLKIRRLTQETTEGVKYIHIDDTADTH